jgi:hypothetical protein
MNVKMIYCNAHAEEIINLFNNPEIEDDDGHIYSEGKDNAEFHSVYTFHVFQSLYLFEPHFWHKGIDAVDDYVLENMRVNYTNLKTLCKLSGLIKM